MPTTTRSDRASELRRRSPGAAYHVFAFKLEGRHSTKTAGLIVNDHPLVRETLYRHLLHRLEPSLEETVTDINEAIRLVWENRPEVILVLSIDRLPNERLADALIIVKAGPKNRVRFLSATVSAITYIKTNLYCERLAAGIIEHAVNASRDPEAGLLRESVRSMRETLLTKREVQTLHLIALGLSKKEIAAQMGIATKTVDRHADQLMKKIRLHDRVELARFAIRHVMVNI
jgi:DNA-binding NarL/FixJ family response regulator